MYWNSNFEYLSVYLSVYFKLYKFIIIYLSVLYNVYDFLSHRQNLKTRITWFGFFIFNFIHYLARKKIICLLYKLLLSITLSRTLNWYTASFIKIFCNTTLKLNSIFKNFHFSSTRKTNELCSFCTPFISGFYLCVQTKNWHRNSLILLSSKLCYVAYKSTKRRIKTTG